MRHALHPRSPRSPRPRAAAGSASCACRAPNLDALLTGIAGSVPPARVATFAIFRDASGAALDQGLVLHFPAPHSYTGETVVELHGHGGPAVLRLLLARCVELGARLAEPGEFTKRAFLNGKLDLAQAESVADLIDAATTTAARAATRSLAGEFSREVHALVAALIELRMYTEATLDFPEEDVEFLREGDVARKLAAIRADLERVLARARTGALLREGLTVVLVGRPNVGKSSLLNQLAREDAAIVTPIPGTTRDAVERVIEIAGIPLTVVDTAGLRDTDDVVERIGIERTWAAVERADLVVLLVDARDTRAGAGSGRSGDPRPAAGRAAARGRAQQDRSRRHRAARCSRSMKRERRAAMCGCAPRAATDSRSSNVKCWRWSVWRVSPRIPISPARGTLQRCGTPRIIWPWPRTTLRPRRRRSSCSPRSCGKPRRHWRRSPANSPPTICWA